MPDSPAPASSDFEYDGFDLESLAELVRYQEWILSHFRNTLRGTVLELGSGSGAISEHLSKYCPELILVEPSSKHVHMLRSKFHGHDHVRICENTLEAQLVSMPEASVDSIVMVNVLEHIEDDNGAIAQMHRALKPGGHLHIMVPALPFLFSNMDIRLGHFRRYRLKSLTSMLADAGFHISVASYMDFIGVLPWWIINTLAGKTDFNPTLVRIYDRFFVPLGTWLESAIRPPLGKNIVLVAQRRQQGV